MSLSVLVLGGSGFVGRALCEQLTRQFGAGVRITVPTRRLRHAQSVQPLPGVTVLQADVFNDLPRLIPGHDVVVNLIAILQGSTAAFERVHVELPRRIASAMTGAGVTRLVHVSALGVSEQAPSRYLRSKAAGEAVLQVAAQTQGLALTLVRPSLVFGAGDASVNLFAQLQGLFPLMPLAGAQAQLQPVWVQDLAAALVQVLLRREAIGETYDGTRRIIPIVGGGRVEGPLISGKLIGNAADWQVTRPDGVTFADAIYALETDDGVVIQIRNRGLRHGPPEVMQRLASGQEVDPAEYYFRTVPEFIAPKGKYDWMNRSIFVCSGARYPLGIKLWVWRVT